MENPALLNGTFYKEGGYPFYKDFILRNVFTEVQRIAFCEAETVYDECFLLSKKNRLAEAGSVYNKCSVIHMLLDPVVATWVMALCGPRLSYYHYKIGDPSRAITFTEEIIEANRLLQDKGFQYLFFSEIQQFHNLSRIYFSLKHTARAVDLCIDILMNIVRRVKTWNPGMIMDGIREEKLIEAAQYGMIIQVMTETFVRILLCFETDSAVLRYWLQRFINPLSEIGFYRLSDDSRYKYFDELILFLQQAVLNKTGINEKSALFTERHKVDKTIIEVLSRYIMFCISEKEAEIAAA